MASNKKRKHIRAIDNHEFEQFTRTNLADDLADIILLTIRIRSHVGLFQSHDSNAELLDAYESINEKDLFYFISYNNELSSSLEKSR
jgi:hypothetical protein